MKNTIFQAVLLLLFTGAVALANPFYLGGTQGDLTFSVVFNNLGNGSLEIDLTNTGTTSPNDDTGVLGALFFNLAGDPVLTPLSLSLGVGSTVVNGTGDPGPNWQYKAGISGPGGATRGLSAVGYGVFGPSGNFCSGPNCGNLLDGVDWGLVDDAYIPGSGNSSISGHALVQNSLIFLLSGIPEDFDPSTGVSTVNAQFATSLSGPNVPGTAAPEPASYLMIAAGLGFIGVIGRGRRIARNVTK